MSVLFMKIRYVFADLGMTSCPWSDGLFDPRLNSFLTSAQLLGPKMDDWTKRFVSVFVRQGMEPPPG